jgi:CheY-like chemotaxis protein
VLRSEDSWRFLARLKQEAHTRDIPVLIASTIEDQAKAFHLGADEYLLKPVEREQLLSKLGELTGPAQAMRILIIDDDERDRYLLKQQFRQSEVVIREVSQGVTGLAEACRERPNAIILDLTMPDMSGFEVLDALKADVATKDIPVVICTSRVLTDSERLRLTGKAIAILSKEGQGLQQIAEVIRRTAGPVSIGAVAI